MTNLTGASQLDSTGIPTGSVKVPGTTLLKAIQGGKILTDSLGDDSAPIRAESAGSTKATYTILYTYKTHSIADTGGTSTSPAAIQRDSSDAAPTATIFLYSAAPTINASAIIVENIWTQLAVTMTTASALPLPVVHEYGLGPYEPWVLRGVAQEFAINFNSVAVPAGGLYTYEITWSEE